MRKSRRSCLALFVVAIATSVTPAGAQTPAATPTPGPGGAGITSAAAILVNLSDEGQILFTRSARIPRAPASLTKVVTALVARDEYGIDEVVTASPLVLQTRGSDLGLEPGMQITVRELLYALLLKSANDSGMALAAHHPGGYEHFIALMNAKARSLGAYDSSFRNPHGLDQIGHLSSAYDMAIFSREFVADEILREISGTRMHTMIWKGRSRTYGHHHKLLRRDISVIGGKTGFTNQAGHSLITVADTPAGRLVAVVMGSSDQYAETSNLFAYGRARSVGEASGGGSVEGFGRLAAPPAPPDEALPLVAPRGSDPRDDMRWSILMIVLALLTAATLISRRRTVTAEAGVYAWLSELAADERRRR